MKNYASNRAQKGKTAYRTPSLYKANKAMAAARLKGLAAKKKSSWERRGGNLRKYN